MMLKRLLVLVLLSASAQSVGLRYVRAPPLDENALAAAIVNYGTLVMSISGENRDFQMYRASQSNNSKRYFSCIP